MNQVRVLGSHNSYKRAIDPPLALISGAQIISTDYYDPDPAFNTG